MEEDREKKLTIDLPADEFQQLLTLAINRPWLSKKGEALHFLWSECESPEQKELVHDLLLRFHFLDGDELDTCLNNIVGTIVGSWNLQNTDTRLFAISNDHEADGSQALLNALNAPFSTHKGWTSAFNFRNSLNDFHNQLTDIKNIVLIDDFIGTGNTIKRKVDWILRHLEDHRIVDCNVYVCSMAGMSFSKEILDNLNIQYFSPIWLEKAISEHYHDAQLEEAIDSMKKLEESLSKKWNKLKLSKFRFGYNASEAAFAARSFNIPNNVFPIFWWGRGTKGVRPTLFGRIQ